MCLACPFFEHRRRVASGPVEYRRTDVGGGGQDGRMDSVRLRAARLVHHALVVPDAGLGAAARRLTATQAQEFWAGRWARHPHGGEVTLTDVDDAFARGVLVRSWTQRGTLHIVAAEDLAWILELTRERQRQAAGCTVRSASKPTTSCAPSEPSGPRSRAATA
jgi:hypothetical protein